MRLIPTILCVLMFSSPLLAADEVTAEAVLKATGVSGGWIMNVGTSNGVLEAALGKDDRFTVTGVARESASADKARAHLRSVGLLGKVHIHEPQDTSKVPTKTDTLSLLICDLDTTGIVRSEAERAIAPMGKAYLKQGGQWQVWQKPWPKDIDNWTHYDYGANSNDASKDLKAGFARGLQWVNGAYGGDEGMGVRLINGIAINPESSKSWPEDRLVARDAFNGAPLWTRVSPGQGAGKSSGMPDSRYGFFVDDKRGYILWRSQDHMESFDLRTGKTLLTFDQGFSRKEYPASDLKARTGRGEPMKALVSEGKLVQVYKSRIRVLDAATGALLWKHEEADRAFDNPLVQAGRRVVCEGAAWKHRDSANYLEDTGLFFTEALTAFDLATGKPVWRTANPVLATNPCVRNMASEDGYVSVLFEMDGKYDHARNKFTTHTLALFKAGDGGLVWSKSETLAGGDQHQKRTAFNRGKVWFIDIGKAIPFDLDASKSGTPLSNEAFSLNGLWGCTLPRMTPNGITWWLAGESFVDQSRSISIVGRNGCDMGSVPAQGLLYLTPSVACGCYGFMNVHSAYHHRKPTDPFTGDRLVKGTGSPAAAAAAATWPADDDWPMYLRDPRRSSWSPATVPAKPTIAWQAKAIPEVPAWAKTMDWDQAAHRVGAVSAPTVAEGVLAVGTYDTQEVVVMDPASGSEKWRVAVDGRIDSPPTIHQGAVYVGTRAGWLYAFNRDTGALIWKFSAAPTGELILAMGSSENASPLFGTVMVEDGLVWTNAGRYVELDHGVTWWGLDPKTGAVRKTGVLRDEGVWRDPDGKEGKRGQKPGLGYRRQTGQNTPLVTDGTNMILHRAGFNVKTGEPAKPGTDFNVGVSPYGGFPEATSQLLVGNYTTLLRDDARGGSSRMGRGMTVYGVCGYQLAYHPDGRVLSLNGMFGSGGRSVLGERPEVALWTRDPASKTQTLKAPAWKQSIAAAKRAIPALGIAAAGDKVVSLLAGDTARVEIRAIADGALLSSIPLPGKAVSSGLAIAGGAIYVTLEDGSVVCVR